MDVDFRHMEIAPRRASLRASRSTPEAVRSVQRALSLVALFSPEQPSLTLTQLAQQSGLALSTVSRLLQTLESLQFIRHLDNGAWGLGVRILHLGAAAQETFDVIGVSTMRSSQDPRCVNRNGDSSRL